MEKRCVSAAPAGHDAALTFVSVGVLSHVLGPPPQSSKQVTRRPPPGLDFPTAFKRGLSRGFLFIRG